MNRSDTLPRWDRVLVVVAHPDDETFGLGGVIERFVDGGGEVHVVCLTHGEALTLGAGDLRQIRRIEAERAAATLGIAAVTLLDHPDGGLADTDPRALAGDIEAAVRIHQPDGLLVFGPGGITGHPDHLTATAVAVDLASRHGIGALGLVIPSPVADELGAGFVGHEHADLVVSVDRTRHLEACRCHTSQMSPIVERKLEVLGPTEGLVWMTADDITTRPAPSTGR